MLQKNKSYHIPKSIWISEFFLYSYIKYKWFTDIIKLDLKSYYMSSLSYFYVCIILYEYLKYDE
jgi:hypothetical protein